MRVGWKEYYESWIARIGPCMISLRRMTWYDARASEFRETIDRAWTCTVRVYDSDDPTKADTIAEAAFETTRVYYDGGLREAQNRAIEIARETGRCKRVKREREALSSEAVEWLENRLLETLRDSYARWRENRRYSSHYPEPQWSTALLAMEAAQYHRPDELEVSDKRFYSLVRTTLERLRRRGLVAGSVGVVDGRETTLWEPV